MLSTSLSLSRRVSAIKRLVLKDCAIVESFAHRPGLSPLQQSTETKLVTNDHNNHHINSRLSQFLCHDSSLHLRLPYVVVGKPMNDVVRET
jgi:hypothetical protein